ncbi:MAG: NAD(P)-dependent oxidoreductase [Candidatus Poribacteria bacterium]|nr:NAD(P)-dependent oxidoreductase [Candidatus Poribacteria bacterium]
MRVLLTGNKGFIGREIKEVLTKENALAVHGEDSDNYRAFLHWFEDTDFSYYDLVIHCGAISDSRQCDNELWQMNYQASCQIARACEQSNTKLLFISSAAAIEPDTPYGWSKHCAEFYMQQKVAGMNLCILRPFNVWSFDESEKANPSIVYKIITGRLQQVYWRCQRDFIHITDVVSAVQQVIHNWTPGTFELGTAQPTDIVTLVNHLYDGVDCLKAGVGPKPPVVSECPISEHLVARHEHLLPNWQATPISEHLEYLKEQMRKE